MCGIAGFFGDKKISSESIKNCQILMKNRGPDFFNLHQETISNNRSICLLHSRLSIIDLNDRSNQPYKIGDYVLVYNGEIYNYLELRKQLEEKGVKLKTNSDTEILLHFYILYGEKCVDYFDGMWSFAIYNSKKNTLFLSRDRFAEKPLYYYKAKEGIYFASEIKFIKSLSEKKFEVNKKKINQYLSFGPRSVFKNNDTFYNDIKLLGYSENLIFDNSFNLKINKYWKPKISIDKNIKKKEAIELTRKQLIKTVKLRLRADVPAAFCLSGGVDSGGLASIATKELNYKIKTFSIIDDEDERYNELSNIKKVVKDLDCEHQIINVSKNNFIQKLSKLIHYHDSPVYSLAQYLQSCLMGSIGDAGYKIAISGGGADEMFSGYYDHYLLHFNYLNGSKLYQENSKNWAKYVKPNIRNEIFRNERLFIDNPKYRNYIYDNSETLSSYLVNPEKFIFEEKNFTKDLFSNRRLNELFYEQIQPTLNNEDLNAMMYSVENRSPFLSKEMLEMCFSFSPGMLIQDGFAKYILRSALKGILIDDIRNDRQKKGFNCSIKSLINFKDEETMDYLLDPKSKIFEYVDIREFRKIFEQDLTLNYFSKFIFAFLSVKIFLDQNEN